MRETAFHPQRILNKRYALPPEHGAWIWWLGPLVIGMAAAGQLRPELALLTIASLAAFLLRHPSTILIKTFTGRRPRLDRTPAWIWAVLYAGLAAVAVAGLVLTGQAKILFLGLPGLPVFLWHLWLVSRREERGQPGVEIIAAGVLALAAPAGYWVAGGEADRIAWLLWILTWLQSASSIVFVYLRLSHRKLENFPSLCDRMRMGTRALSYYGFNLFLCLGCVLLGWIPYGVLLAFAVQMGDAIQGVLQPTIGLRPTSIGFRQLAFSLIFVGMMATAFLT